MKFTFYVFLCSFLFVFNLFAEELDIRVLRVEFKKENPDNSYTTGDGTFDSDTKNYKLNPNGARAKKEYWESNLKFAKNYFEQVSNNKVYIDYEIFPKQNDSSYKLDKNILDYVRTNRRENEKLAEFEKEVAEDYARFVNDVLTLAANDSVDKPFYDITEKTVFLIAHAGANRLIDGGTMGTRGANTPGDFIDSYIDSSWGEFWRGFPLDTLTGDSIRHVIVTSESASQDNLNWGINGIIISQLGRVLGLPYSYDVVKGFSRLGYFDGMDFAGSNAGNGFFPSFPSAWMRVYKGWENATNIPIGKDTTIYICAAGYTGCGNSTKVVKIPINNNEYILLENRQKSYRTDGKISIQMNDLQRIEIPSDSLAYYFLDSASQKYSGVIENIDDFDAALPASGIAAWKVNDWYIKEFLPYGAINAWNGDNVRDHQFGISLIEADGVLALGKEFRTMSGESAFYFGSGSDLIPHKKKSITKNYDTVFSITPEGYNKSGYANTGSTFGGFSGIKITAQIPTNAVEEKSINSLTGDSVITWRALEIPVKIEWVGKYAQLISEEEWPIQPTEEDFSASKQRDSSRIVADIDNDGFLDSVFLANNRLHVIDSNGVPIKNFPVILSNNEPFTYFSSKPLPIDINGDGKLEILVPANNGLILAVNSDGKLLKDGFPLAAGTFEYESKDSLLIAKPDTLLLYLYKNNESKYYLFSKHRGFAKAFYLPEAKEYNAEQKQNERKEEITEFFIFPNPVRSGKASMRFRTLDKAASATLDIYDITGNKVFSYNTGNVNHGSNQIENLNLSNLGSDVYSARLTVKFDKSKKSKWVRIGVIKK